MYISSIGSQLMQQVFYSHLIFLSGYHMFGSHTYYSDEQPFDYKKHTIFHIDSDVTQSHSFIRQLETIFYQFL
jgi:hypothetical protein